MFVIRRVLITQRGIQPLTFANNWVKKSNLTEMKFIIIEHDAIFLENDIESHDTIGLHNDISTL